MQRGRQQDDNGIDPALASSPVLHAPGQHGHCVVPLLLLPWASSGGELLLCPLIVPPRERPFTRGEDANDNNNKRRAKPTGRAQRLPLRPPPSLWPWPSSMVPDLTTWRWKLHVKRTISVAAQFGYRQGQPTVHFLTSTVVILLEFCEQRRDIR